jgi:triphosphoribosyl-dephospho-CoA synthase
MTAANSSLDITSAPAAKGEQLPPGMAATLASLYEATAPKPGNVHPTAAFDDTTNYAAFVRSAIVVGPILEQARTMGVGPAVLEAVRQTQAAVGTNTNLGTLLLIAPLAAAPADRPLVEGLATVLDRLSAADTRAVYEAIRLAQAGGLGRVAEGDVSQAPPPDLTLAGRHAARCRSRSRRPAVHEQFCRRVPGPGPLD